MLERYREVGQANETRHVGCAHADALRRGGVSDV
jgi:hypothetical protein